jgi:O-antigen/teichoic acid export membrane protein
VVILTQLDKVFLSKMLALEMFGYYVLAGVVAGALNYVSGPIFSALFPRLTQSVGSGNATELALLYHKGCQLMAALVSPLWIVLVLFSGELMTLWMGDAQVAANTHLLVSLLATGTALNAFMTLPYALQLAHGWTSLSLYKNLVSVAVLVPLLYWLIARYGAVGAALTWVALNAGYLLFEIPLMHRRLLKDGMGRWYLLDVGAPVGVCLGIGLAARLAMPPAMPAYAVVLWILSALAVCFLCVALVMPHTRGWVRQLGFLRAQA